MGGNETGLNIEWWFRIIYECLMGRCFFRFDWTVFLANLWLWITWIGYILILLGILMIIYTMVKLYDLRKREEEQYGELIIDDESAGPNKRWEHIEDLIGGSEPSDWRQAIIESDIVLEEMLTRQGYSGSGVGEKLKQVEPSDFDTLQDALEAHKVRNQIAHEGSVFDLSETLARRTVARYESVFREFGFI